MNNFDRSLQSDILGWTASCCVLGFGLGVCATAAPWAHARTASIQAAFLLGRSRRPLSVGGATAYIASGEIEVPPSALHSI